MLINDFCLLLRKFLSGVRKVGLEGSEGGFDFRRLRFGNFQSLPKL